MKFLVALALVFATSLSAFSQTKPKNPKSPTQDTSLSEIMESLQNDPEIQQGVSALARGFFSGVAPTPEAILNTPLPSFSLKTIKNKKISSADLLGKVTLIRIWDPECEDCLQEIPDLNQLKSAYQKQDVVFLSLPIADAKTLKEYLKQHPLHFQHIPEAISLIQELSYTPQSILVDKHGVIRYVAQDPFDNMLQAKPTDWQLVQEQINTLLIARR